MAIGFAGIGAGTDWSTIISQLVQIESAPLYQLQSREQKLDYQISDYGLVKSAISSFQSAMESMQSGFAQYTGSSTNEDVLTVSAESNAVESSYSVVVSQLAEADKIASSSYADSNTAVGTGTLSLTVNGETLDITVDATNNTLAGLRDAINSASTNPGVSASIINTASGSRLVLTGSETGAANAVNISIVDADDGNNTDQNGLSKLFYIGVGDDGYAEQISTAKDALLEIDGFDITSASNTVTGAIDGVSLKLTDLGTSNISIARDDAQISEKVGEFVDAYNSLQEQLSTFAAGTLSGDSSLRQIGTGLVSILNQSADINGDLTYLFEAGVARDKNGVLSLDSTALSEAMDRDLDKISSLFTDSTVGFAQRFADYADSLLGTGGVISVREEGLESRKRLLENQIERQELRIEIVEKTLVEKFAALDSTVSLLQSTSTYLTNQLSSLSNN